jgi:hypothetical protein
MTSIPRKERSRDMEKRPVRIEDRSVVVRRRICRVAEIDGEVHEFLAAPKSAIASLRSSGMRADLFRFMQAVPKTSALYGYLYEWDNFAVLPISARACY